MDKELENYYHRVVDCQWACPTHTPVPEYIRLVRDGKYTEAYLINRESNVFPGILGRVCDAPCEDACRRSRVDDQAVGICRLKRVAADQLDPQRLKASLPSIPKKKNGIRIAIIGAGPAALTVANDLLPLGYHISIFAKEEQGGGAMLTQVPRFRLPLSVLQEEIGFITAMGAECHWKSEIKSLKTLLAQDFAAVVVATGAPRGKSLLLQSDELASHELKPVAIASEFLAAVHHGQKKSVHSNVLIIGGGNTAMDCSRTALRLGAKQVTVATPEAYEEMRAFKHEKRDAKDEGIRILNHLLPKEVKTEKRVIEGVIFSHLTRCFDHHGQWAPLPSGQNDIFVPCEEIIYAVGQEVAFPFIDEDLGITMTPNQGDTDMRPQVDPVTQQSSHPQVFFAGDAVSGPRNIIWAVASGHEVALSLHLKFSGLNMHDRPRSLSALTSQKMSMNQWSYDNNYYEQSRVRVPHRPLQEALSKITIEKELGYDTQLAIKEAQRCLDCDMQTVFKHELCIECNSCVDICPTACLTMTEERPREELRENLTAPTLVEDQPLFVSLQLPQTPRVMVKDENLCIHCGLCAERCPTAAWDMQQFTLQPPRARSVSPCQSKPRSTTLS